MRDDGKRQWMVTDHHGKDVVSPASFVFRAKVKLRVSYAHTSVELTRGDNEMRGFIRRFSSDVPMERVMNYDCLRKFEILAEDPMI